MIEEGLDWDGEPGALVRALVATGWLDEDPANRLLVHDWLDHAEEAVKKSLPRRGLSVAAPWRPERDNGGPVSRSPLPLPKPMPYTLPAPPLPRGGTRSRPNDREGWDRELQPRGRVLVLRRHLRRSPDSV